MFADRDGDATPVDIQGRQTRTKVGADIVEHGQKDHAKADPEKARAKEIGHAVRSVKTTGQVQGHMRQGKGEFLGFDPLALEDQEEAEAENHHGHGHAQPLGHCS